MRIGSLKILPASQAQKSFKEGLGKVVLSFRLVDFGLGTRLPFETSQSGSMTALKQSRR
jgi:hypothetical protein